MKAARRLVEVCLYTNSKEKGANKYDQQTFISLMSHHRIRTKCEQDVREEQFGFRQELGKYFSASR